MTGGRPSALNGPTDYGWRDRAACKGHDVDDWFANVGSEAADRALAVCQMCPVRRECLTEALSMEGPGYQYGVWGGVIGTDRERALRRRQREGIRLSVIVDDLLTEAEPVAA